MSRHGVVNKASIDYKECATNRSWINDCKNQAELMGREIQFKVNRVKHHLRWVYRIDPSIKNSIEIIIIENRYCCFWVQG